MKIILMAVIIASLLVPCLVKTAIAGEPTPLSGVTLKSKTTYDNDGEYYVYTYTLSNPHTNSLSVKSLTMDIKLDAGSRELSDEGLFLREGFRSDTGEIIVRSFKSEFNELKELDMPPVIPVGMTPPKATWAASITVHGTAIWASIRDGESIKPGEGLNGFVVYTRGIPAIRKIIVKPDYIFGIEEIISYGVPEDEIYNNKKAILAEYYDKISFHAITVGPVAPPKVLNPVGFVDSIIKMKHEAAELGWITNKGIVQSLDQKLEAAKRQLQSNNRGEAVNILGAFIHEVEAQSCGTHDKCPPGKHILPEAEALLKYNAAYLRDNLR